MAKTQGVVDIRVENHGTIFILRPYTPVGADWLEEHLDPVAYQFSDAPVVEHRYVADIVAGAREAGLVVV